MKRLLRTLAGVALASLASTAAAQSYRIINLTPLSAFDQVLAYGISPNGMITGAGYTNATGELDAFIYANGVFQNLGTFGWVGGADGDKINDSGQVAATGYQPGYHALLYSNGIAKPLGGVDGGYSVGLSINTFGDIVGRAVNGDGNGQGFSYIGGKFNAMNIDLARCINDSDQIAGSVAYTWTAGGFGHVVEHACIVAGTTITDLGNLGGGPRTNHEAYGINNSGQVTGYSTLADGTIHAFLYSGGAMADLGTFAPYYTYGVSVNNFGVVAGNIETFAGANEGVFVYSNGVLNNLADISDSSMNAWSGMLVSQMNDSGYIVGYGNFNGGGPYGYLAQPYYVDVPGAYTVYRGIYASGSVASLAAIDGDYLSVLSGPTLTSTEPSVSVIVDGTSTVAAPADLRLSLTAHTNTTGISQTIELWDFQASAWVNVSSQAATTSDSTEVAISSSPTRFVEAGTQAVRARVSWKQTGPTLIYRWTAKIDQAVWNVSP